MKAVRARVVAVALILSLAGIVVAEDQAIKSYFASQARPMIAADWSTPAGPRGSALAYVRPATADLPGPAGMVTPSPILLILSLGLVFALVDLRHLKRPSLVAGLALVIGGVAGNAADLLVRGKSVDFIAVALDGRLLAVVNVADVAIVAGTAVLMLALAVDLVDTVTDLPRSATTAVRWMWCHLRNSGGRP